MTDTNKDTLSDHLPPLPPKPEELKMWLAIRTDIDMPPGKLAVQAGHAFAGLYKINTASPGYAQYDDGKFFAYDDGPTPKIAVSVSTCDALLRVQEECYKAKIPSRLIQDAGRTVFKEPTYTVCAFGPARRSELPRFLQRLQLYE